MSVRSPLSRHPLALHFPFGPRGSTVSGRQSRLKELNGSTLPVFVLTSVTTLLAVRSTVTSMVSLREASTVSSTALMAAPQAGLVGPSTAVAAHYVRRKQSSHDRATHAHSA
jgi:hypothetical protein